MTQTIDTPPPPPTWAPPLPPHGVHQVGVDIVAGTYHTDGESGGYREKSTGGEGIGGIIDNDNISGPVTLVIEPSVKFFKSARCGTWTKR